MNVNETKTQPDKLSEIESRLDALKCQACSLAQGDQHNSSGVTLENKSNLDVDLGAGEVKFTSSKTFKFGKWSGIILAFGLAATSSVWMPRITGDGADQIVPVETGTPVYIYRTDPRADAAIGFCESLKADRTAYYNLPMTKQGELNALLAIPATTGPGVASAGD